MSAKKNLQKRHIDSDEEDSDGGISLQDVINQDNAMEEAAVAVLGAGSTEECTYPKGYVKRQALYACATCTSDNDDAEYAGVCLACSLNCHQGHDLYELYTKRNFRCDCGNDKFSTECGLQPRKDACNADNVYNQNFEGLYCTCHQPYPNDDIEEQDEPEDMIQCVVCEDWYHTNHLGEVQPPDDNDFAEMICAGCTAKCTFLNRYKPLAIGSCAQNKSRNHIDVANHLANNTFLCNYYKGGGRSDADGNKQGSPGTSTKRRRLSCDDSPEKHADNLPFKGATFWPEKWRSCLCKCNKCIATYKRLDVAFLPDEEDSVHFYEELGKNCGPASGGLDVTSATALKSLPFVQQMELIHGYNEMKEALSEFLKSFAEENRVVTADDIKQFFTQLRNNASAVSSLPYNCR